ncbi:MAG: bifunctional folylpolyglutamate synthase/dihydrofolate synthase, partial [Verrucomicrobiota bacterium]
MNATECYLYGLRNRGSKYGLERMQRLVATLDQPQRSYPAIHVAGTNGKGSVCAMLESIYRHAGYRVGLLTSPHLVHLGERIQVNREPLCDEQITAYTQELRPVAESLAAGEVDMHPTFFELIAAMGFLHFQREQVDLAIIETGLGGRLDATNVVDPL